MNVKPRAFGTAFVYASTALAALALAEAILTLRNGGRFPWSLGAVLTIALVPALAGLLVSVHYWRSSEFKPRRIVLWPLLLALLMAGVMVGTSPFIERPRAQLARSVTPQSIPALPPVSPRPTPKAAAYELIGTDTYLVWAGGWAEVMQGMSSDRLMAGGERA